MEIVIITHHRVMNYGAVLQTFATQKLFEESGVKATIINYVRKDLYFRAILNEGISKSSLKKNVFGRTCYRLIRFPLVLKMEMVFKGFIKRKLRLTKDSYNDNKLYINPPVSDIYCTGSDQTWNTICNHGIVPAYFLDFAPEDKLKVAFSASFGKDYLEVEEKKKIQNYLSRYDYISVREISGLTLAREMELENVSNILDPTLLYGKQWKNQLKDSRKSNKKYILVYQLNNNQKFNAYVNDFAKYKKMKIITIGVRYMHLINCKNVRLFPSVNNWLKLFYNAEYVITDSFHGTAFSIIFEKKFAVIYPDEFSTRLQSVLEIFNLESRKVTNYDNFRMLDEYIDYEGINKKMIEERERAFQFISEIKNAVIKGEAK